MRHIQITFVLTLSYSMFIYVPCIRWIAFYSKGKTERKKERKNSEENHMHTHTHGERRSSHGEIERDAHINYHYPLSEQIKLHEE